MCNSMSCAGQVIVSRDDEAGNECPPGKSHIQKRVGGMLRNREPRRDTQECFVISTFTVQQRKASPS